MQVSLYSERAIPDGVHIKLVADAITDAQRVVLAHGGPLPLRLQRLLAPTDKCKASGIRGATMFSAPQDRRVATLAVPKVCTSGPPVSPPCRKLLYMFLHSSSLADCIYVLIAGFRLETWLTPAARSCSQMCTGCSRCSAEAVMWLVQSMSHHEQT